MIYSVIWLDGLPGTGKTSIATELSSLLGCPSIDIDDIKIGFLRQEYERSVAGEIAYDLIFQLLANSGGSYVIAAPISVEATLRRVRELGISRHLMLVTLHAEPETIRERCRTRFATDNIVNQYRTADYHKSFTYLNQLEIEGALSLDTTTLSARESAAAIIGAQPRHPEDQASDWVVASGVFDMLHMGHLRYLQEASRYGPLLVHVATDKQVSIRKGKMRPVIPEKERLALVQSLRIVQRAVLFEGNTFELARCINARRLVLSSEVTGEFERLRATDSEYSPVISYMERDTSAWPSTSGIVERIQRAYKAEECQNGSDRSGKAENV